MAWQQVMAPAHFGRQCLLNWKGEVKAPHAPQVVVTKALAKFFGELFAQSADQAVVLQTCGSAF
jgi:hypothetical protein